MTARVVVRANAKINWGLELLARRDDGYHEIRTITQTVSVHDTVAVALAEAGLRLSVRGTWGAPEGPPNLCWRAAELFRERYGVPAGVTITLDKHVPAGAGLGGGSSDCVATLAALALLTGAGEAHELGELAAALGSDTVLFLTGGAAVCSGRGEIVAPLAGTRRYDLVIAKPDCSVATAEAYAMMGPEDFSDGSRMTALAALLGSSAEPARVATQLANAFEAKVAALLPPVAELRADMMAAGALGARLTGSGSAVFGLAADAVAAAQIAAKLAARGYWATAAQSTPHGFEILEGRRHE